MNTQNLTQEQNELIELIQKLDIDPEKRAYFLDAIENNESEELYNELDAFIADFIQEKEEKAHQIDKDIQAKQKELTALKEKNAPAKQEIQKQYRKEFKETFDNASYEMDEIVKEAQSMDDTVKEEEQHQQELDTVANIQKNLQKNKQELETAEDIKKRLGI